MNSRDFTLQTIRFFIIYFTLITISNPNLLPHINQIRVFNSINFSQLLIGRTELCGNTA